MSTSQTLVPPTFPQPISQTMINNPTFHMINNVNHVHNIITKADVFERLFNQICVDAFAESGLYDDMKCHPGTRKLILERLENWVASPGNADRLITWLDGPMGSGKTSVAVTMTDHMSAKKKLIGSFVFRRGQPGRNEDTRFVATLAYQMAISIPLVRPFIEEQICHDQSILHQSLSRQLDALILNPLRKMRLQNPDIDVAVFPNLIIVDGLDECGEDRKDGEESRDGKKKERGKVEQQLGLLELLHRLALAQDVLPFAILLHSRPEMHINHWFSMDQHARITYRFTLDSSYKPNDDIRLFVTHGLLSLLDTHPLCLHLQETKWPYEVLITDIWGKKVLVNAIDLIVKRSEGLFVYATIVIRYISSKSHQPAERLLQILEMRPALHNTPASPYTTLDALYTQILDSTGNPQVGRRILKFNALLSYPGRPQPSLPPLSILLELLSISMHDFDYFTQQAASILTHGTKSFLSFQHSSLAEFLWSSQRSQHWCIHNYEPEIAHDIALNAIKCFSNESSVSTQLSCYRILWCTLRDRAHYRTHENRWSLALMKELEGFFDFQNSSYRTPVMRVLTSDARTIFFETFVAMFRSLEAFRYGRYYKKWVYRFGSHIRMLVKPHVQRYLESPRLFAMFICWVFNIPASNTDYMENIPPSTDCALCLGQWYKRDWAAFFSPPAEWIVHVFSIRNVDFLCEAFTIVLKHAGRPSVMFHQQGILIFIGILVRKKLISQGLWLAILDYEEDFTPYVRNNLHRIFFDQNTLVYPFTFRPLHHQHQYCPNPILPFQIALGQCYWEPANNTHDIGGHAFWFLKNNNGQSQQILIPSVPPLARYMAYCSTPRNTVPVPTYDVRCPCSGHSCFDNFPKWMRL